ncbi:MAG: pyridoxal phosphate-dependent aminotransferase [Clostridiales bacterium]|nr:pyridoxal phosphate-dependent aminotransferase [Candidatus Blautia equi]
MLAKRMQKVSVSATNALAAKIDAMRADGMEILAFHIGEPDFDTPEKILEAGNKALAEGKTRYVSVSGIPELKKAVAEKLEKENGMHYEPSQICISTGAKQAVYNAIMAVVDEGDEVLIPTPCWVSYVDMVKMANGTPVLVKPGKDYTLDLEAIEAAVTDKTKLIVINTPNNPTGACYDRESLLKLGEMAVKYDFYILADEVYEKLIYGKEHVSVASLSDEIYAHSITVNGFSKAFAMTGWRLGYSAAPADVAKAIVAIQSNCTSNSTSFVQYAALTALKECEADVLRMKEEYERRRDYAYMRMSSIPGVTCTKPDGAFYLMPDITSFLGKKGNGKVIENSMDLCAYVLEEAKIAITPGDAFKMPGTIRLAYPASMADIKEGMDRLEQALAKIQ